MLRPFAIMLLASLALGRVARADSAMSLVVEHELKQQDKQGKTGKFSKAVKEKYRALYQKSPTREHLFLYVRVLDKSDAKTRLELSDRLLREKNFAYAYWPAALVMQDEGRHYDAYKYWQKACAAGLEYTCAKAEDIAEAVCAGTVPEECAKIGAFESAQKRIPTARRYLESACKSGSSEGCYNRGLIDFEFGDLVETRIWMIRGCERSHKKACDMSQRILASLGEGGGMQDSLAEFERGCTEGREKSCREAERLREALREPASEPKDKSEAKPRP